MLVTDAGIEMLASPVQSAKALALMLVTVEGMA